MKEIDRIIIPITGNKVWEYLLVVTSTDDRYDPDDNDS
jgi:hypothetical protein